MTWMICQLKLRSGARWRALLLAVLVALSMAACTLNEPQQPATPDAGAPITVPPTTVPPPSPAATTLAASPTPRPSWQPTLGMSWQWQLTDLPLDQAVDADMYDIDLFENNARVVAALHARGRRVICYISAGTWEKWRPDAGAYPAGVLGLEVEGWPDERWVDIRQLDVIGPIIERRMDLCKTKGFNGIEPDNVDAYTNDTGFPLSAQDQLEFNIFLANAAHARDLAVGLKNDLEQVDDLVAYFDFAINEQCFQERRCDRLAPFVQAGKAVFHVEYRLPAEQFCPRTTALGFSSMKKNRDLDAYREPCP